MTRGYGDRWWEDDKPADLEISPAVAAASAAKGSKDSYVKKISLPLVKNKQYKFFFTYLHEDSETQEIKESDRSPVWTESFDIPNLTKPVQNLTLTAGSQSYGVKFDIDPTAVQEDVVIFESLTSDFATQTIVYTGTSTNVSILTTGATAFSPRWVKVRSRDKWDDENISEATAGPVTPFSADVDTTYTVENPASSSASASIDPKDLSGFSLVSTISWVQSTNVKTAGYAIRWSTDNPETVTNPLWEYASVSGITTTSFTATGLIPNTTYYYQVASTTPYDVVSWTGAASGTFIASDADGTAAGALARLKSFIAIGGASQDLFKIGTGISQSINLNTDPIVSPTLTAGTYHGIILNKSTTNVGNNFWLTTGQFRVGNPTEFMYWNGTNLYLTGSVNATGGKFTGNVQLAIPAGATTSGTLFAGANPTSGARVRFSSEGIFAYDATSTDNATGQTFSLVQSTGRLNANLGTVGGWTLATTGFSSSNTKIENDGNITLGNQVGSIYPIVRLSATDDFRLWIGSNSSSNAPFKVSKEGVLTATGATITGNVQITSGSTLDSIVAAQNAAATASSDATEALTTANGKNSIFRQGSTPSALKAGDIWINFNDENKLYVSTAAGTVSWVLSRDASIAAAVTKADDALASATAAVNTANLAYPAGSFNKSAILQAINIANGGSGTSLNGGIIEANTISATQIVSDYVYAGYIDADKINAGMITGVDIDISTDASSGRFKTSYVRSGPVDDAGITSTAINAVAFVSTSTSGWVTSCYPYWNGGADLGLSNFRWRRLLVGNGNYGEAVDSYVDLGGNVTRLFANGRIYANSLGTGSGNSIVQDAGFLRVQTSSLRYKENVSEINKSGYLSIINLLKPVTYNYIGDTGYNGGPRTLSGLIAEDLHAIPNLRTVVNYNEENQPDGIAYDRLTASLVLAIQEMSDKIDSIQLRLDALEA
jgi:hypothetical protein